MTTRTNWSVPKFKAGDTVRSRYWATDHIETVLDPDIEDGFARYVRTSGGGTWGEGALELVRGITP